MKKFIFLFFFIFFAFNLNAQRFLEQLEFDYAQFELVESYELFTVEEMVSRFSPGGNFIMDNALLLNLNRDALSALLEQEGQNIRIKLPSSDRNTLTLLLKEVSVMSPGGVIRAASQPELHRKIEDYDVKFYRGVVEGSPNSMVSLSVFEEHVMGFVTVGKYNFTLGKMDGYLSDKHIFYLNDELIDNFNFICHTSEEDVVNKRHDRLLPGTRSDEGAPCVRIYFEADYDMFLEFGSVDEVAEYVSALFNQVAILFMNEDINIAISEILVWDIPSPYTADSTSTALLNQFRDELNGNYNGDLAHLLNLKSSLGGRAAVDALCDKVRGVAFSGINTTFLDVPVYSWSVMVVTHEIGHNLGSRHTHGCYWNGDNTQIDDCGNVWFNNIGQTPEGDACFDEDNPILPPEGGTIMSYCHGTGFPGINFNLGFGTQPGDVIRDRVDNASCLGGCPPLAKFIAIPEVGCTPLEVAFIDLSEYNPESWFWEFPGGLPDSSHQQNPEVVYTTPGTYTVLLTVTNSNGSNTVVKEDYIVVYPNEAPYFQNCPQHTITFSNAVNQCGAYVNWSQPVAFENCDTELEVDQTSGPAPGSWLGPGVYTVVYEAEDDSGNSTDCIFEVEVVDQQDPIAVCTDMDAYLDENGEVSITAEDVDGGSSDNCTNEADLILEIDQNSFTCVDIGNNFVTLTVTDEEGQSSICVATVQVIDSIAPTFTCPVDRSISECLGQLPDIYEEVTDLDDNCGADNVTLTQNPAPGLVLPGNPGDVLIVSITATDESGNSTSCEVEVEILDEDVPWFQNCPLTTVTVGNDPNQCSAFANWSQPVAFDNCDDQLDVTQIEGPASGSQIPVGDPVTIVYEAIDSEGNSMTCEFEVQVVDTEAPRFVTTLPLDEIVPCEAIPDPFVVIPEWHTVDNCTDAADIEVEFTEEIKDIVCPHTYTLKRKWTITDEFGNSAFHVQKVYVVDDQAPEFTVPEDITISCDASTDPSNTGEPTDVSDNCSDEADLVIDYSDESTQDPDPANCGHYEYTITRTWTITDECQNVNTQIQVISVEDNNPPMANCQDITVELDEFGHLVISANDVNDGSTDNCADEEFLTLELDRNNFTCADLGENTVTLSVIDPCGNVGICMAIVTVEDNLPPTLECPADIVITLGPGECGAFVSFGPAVLEDNCDVSWSSEPPSGSLFEIGTTVVVITAVDEAGNEVSCTFEVEIIENPVTNFSLACNDFLNVSLGPDCQAEINADMILEGNNHFCYDNYEIVISESHGGPAIPTNPVVTSDYIGDTLVIMVTDPTTGNNCWSYIFIEDKLAPQVECPENITVSCVAHTDTDVTGVPEVLSCEVSVYIDYTDMVTINNKCNQERAKIVRNWTITDASGNTTVCVQQITVEAFDLFAVTFPPDYDGFGAPAFNCTDVAANPSLTEVENTGRPMLNGLELIVNDLPFCDLAIGYEDVILNGCGGSYSIIRAWYVTSLCMPVIQGINPIVHFQRINVWDMDAPVFEEQDEIIVNTRQNDCYGDWIVSAPTFEEDCSGINWYISSSAGFITMQNGVVVLRDIPLGTHTIRYIAHDDCGYFATQDVDLTVVDDVAPVAICDLTTRVSLGIDGTANVNVAAWDDGSYDNCGVMDITARLKDDPEACGNSGLYEEEITFCCGDEFVDVEVRVRDYSGNVNYCWVTVEVEDKLPPTVLCPDKVVIDCKYDFEFPLSQLSDAELNDLLDAEFGGPIAVDNCGVESEDWIIQFDLYDPQCLIGAAVPPVVNPPMDPFTAYRRVFIAEDSSGNQANCLQDIVILPNNEDPFIGDDLPWPQGDINWPDDETVGSCLSSDDDALSPEALGSEPFLRNKGCAKVVAAYEDQVFTFVDSACFKILRTWTVIDWCNHDPNSGQGEWSHVQVINVMDDGPATCNNCEDQVFIDEESTDCTGLAELELDVTDCTPDDMLEVSWRIDAFQTGVWDITGSGLDATGNYPFGTHTIRWEVYDLCSNLAVFEYDFEVVDGKIPSPVCLSDIVTVVMPISDCIEIDAADFDAASFDNCTDSSDLIFSWSEDIEETHMEFCCEEIGINVVEIWVTDEAGNQDFCVVNIMIQDPNDVCGPQAITGSMSTSEGEGVAYVDVELHNAQAGIEQYFTGTGNSYAFVSLELGADYTVIPNRNDNPLNGVSTFDIALIQRHILGIQYLDDPYKLIAADVRPDGVINVLDIADLRALILGKTHEFTQNTSWRFVSTDQQFQPGLVQPPADIEEERVYLDLSTNMRDGDFVGVKVGDVNNSVKANDNSRSGERRTGEVLSLQTEEGVYRSGDMIELDVTAENFDQLVGYQFTLDFDRSGLEWVGLEAGQLEVDESNFGLHMTSEGVITTSWNSMKAESFNRGDVLFTLQFRATREVRTSELFAVNSRITPAEAYRMNGDVLEVDLRFTRNGEVIESDIFALFQNQPNPFNGQTIIGFVLPETMDAELTIYDVTGRVIRVISGNYGAGYNELQLSDDILPASGVYYYQLEAEGYSATKRMILTGN